MKKLVLMTLVVALLVGWAAPVSADPPEGFILSGADAAYADFSANECDVFVGYVWAKSVRYFETGERYSPHSDLEVKVTNCALLPDLVGVVDTVDDDRAEIVKLDSASVDEISVPLGGGVTAVVDLEWTADGDVFNANQKAPGVRANHRTRLADVTGMVTISWDSTTLTFVPGDLDGSERITHYNEIQNSNLP